MQKTAVELFAGVGGFRVGLNAVTKLDKDGRAIEKGPWDFVYADQFEPSTKAQHAFSCYEKRFGEGSVSNEDITLVDKKSIPDHTLLTGGFPCQDYSVARSLHNEKGIEGKKGVLWWEIYDILKAKKPPFALLENVDRLLKAPAKQRGRDFGIILRSLADIGYSAEWRVINAADYGHVQRRRRTFIFAHRDGTRWGYKAKKADPVDWLFHAGFFAPSFAVLTEAECGFQRERDLKRCDIGGSAYRDAIDLQERFGFRFLNAGLMRGSEIFTATLTPYESRKKTLGSILLKKKELLEDSLFLSPERVEKFRYLKGAKKVLRHARSGFSYLYSEGPIPETDPLDKPGRTMLTSEGTVNRSTHVVDDPCFHNEKTGISRRILSPIECERMDEFPDGWTEGMPNRWRYFAMGNALVTGLIKTIGTRIEEIVEAEK